MSYWEIWRLNRSEDVCVVQARDYASAVRAARIKHFGFVLLAMQYRCLGSEHP